MRNLHRKIEPIIALFVLLLAVTGLLLNNSSNLQLDKRYLTWDWLLQHYDISHVDADVVYLLGHRTISQFGSEVFVDARPVTHVDRPLLGGVMLDDLIVLATDDALILLSHDGEFIERMGGAMGIPPNIQNIGLFRGEAVLQTYDGLWRSDFLLDQWERISVQGVGWSLPLPMPESVKAALATYFHGQGVSIERFVSDIRNGRIINIVGTYLADLVSIILILWSFIALWFWLSRQR